MNLKEYEYDFDRCGWFHKSCKSIDEDGNVIPGKKPPMVPPFFISDLTLYKLKQEENE